MQSSSYNDAPTGKQPYYDNTDNMNMGSTAQSGAYTDPAHGNAYQTQTQTQTMQGQRTGAAGKGPDAICKFLDKLEHKFGGSYFNDPTHDAKNQALNQNISKRLKTIAPMVMHKLPQLLMMAKGQL